MRRSSLTLALLFGLIAPALAVDNYTATQGAGTSFRAKDVGAGLLVPYFGVVDATGALIYGPAGTANTNVLTVQGIAAMTPLLVTATLNAETTKVIGTVNQGTSPWVVSNSGTFAVQASVPTWGGGTLGAMANYGTSPGSVLVPGVNAFVTNTNTNSRATSANSSPVVPSAAPSTWHLIAAASTNATSVKGSAATLMSCQLGSNSAAAIGYLKIYNKATAPTVGTDVPVKTLIIPFGSGGSGAVISFGPGGVSLGTGFATAVTGGIADSDATSVAATTFTLNCDYD